MVQSARGRLGWHGEEKRGRGRELAQVGRGRLGQAKGGEERWAEPRRGNFEVKI